ncbi:MAG: FGGY-family carbohydrate kinase [Acidimicrobiia bacterium]|nr:FGGY-family carbohydrate kinase [Acidimicrobiia bacterium]
MAEATVGLDIGTSSVKAVAADGDGAVVARARVPHPLTLDRRRLAHDNTDRAWRADVVRALDEVGADHTVRAVQVAAMVPSLGAFDRDGHGLTPGLLYGDSRGGATPGASPNDSGELQGSGGGARRRHPARHGFWPAQAAANHALCGEAVIDFVTAMTALPVFDMTEWDAEVASEAGASVEQLPRVEHGPGPIGRRRGVPVGAGTIDAFAEQLVAGADQDGDVLVICGSTLITWAVIPEWREAAGLWTVPHTAPGKMLIGGPSNAGGLFLDWVTRLLAPASDDIEPEPDAVPVWCPYPRGERTPLHDADRRAGLHDADIRMGAAGLRRAAHEAQGFVVRHHLDLAEVEARRIVATGGGVRSRGCVLQALADATRLPVDPVAVPEGAALGAAFLARVAAGLEPDASGASRWASHRSRIEPDERWVDVTEARYRRFRQLAGPTRTLTAASRPATASCDRSGLPAGAGRHEGDRE